MAMLPSWTRLPPGNCPAADSATGHHGIRAVDTTAIAPSVYFGTGRQPARLIIDQHLSGDHHGLAAFAGHPGDVFLLAGNFLDGQLHTQIAARPPSGRPKGRGFPTAIRWLSAFRSW